ncbi:lipocalin/fatty-acid binding family protein [Kitasatospora sp. NPDC127067]|uniref:lipocalin/fatty-acid binding family protein n=1 Tax=Kitasatospora sp. NPDC127067 TaxID=3347126 RepID=UPI0036635080
MVNPAFMDFSGMYELATSEGYEEFLESIGVDLANRKVMASAEQTVKIKQEGDHYTLTTTVPTRTTVTQFTLAQEFVEAFDDGRQFKGICRRDGNRIIDQRGMGKIEFTVIRSIDDEGLDVNFTGVNNVVAKRRYKRLG